MKRFPKAVRKQVHLFDLRRGYDGTEPGTFNLGQLDIGNIQDSTNETHSLITVEINVAHGFYPEGLLVVVTSDPVNLRYK
jgi:hypothetical protein